jgi:hypothetical protein
MLEAYLIIIVNPIRSMCRWFDPRGGGICDNSSQTLSLKISVSHCVLKKGGIVVGHRPSGDLLKTKCTNKSYVENFFQIDRRKLGHFLIPKIACKYVVSVSNIRCHVIKSNNLMNPRILHVVV